MTLTTLHLYNFHFFWIKKVLTCSELSLFAIKENPEAQISLMDAFLEQAAMACGNQRFHCHQFGQVI